MKQDRALLFLFFFENLWFNLGINLEGEIMVNYVLKIYSRLDLFRRDSGRISMDGNDNSWRKSGGTTGKDISLPAISIEFMSRRKPAPLSS